MIYLIQRIKDWWRGTGFLLGGVGRSKDWPGVRKDFLIVHDKCAICEGKKKLEVHHIKSFFRSPELELDRTNLIVLCEAKKYGITCHLFGGHNGNYKLENPLILEDVKFLSDKLKRND